MAEEIERHRTDDEQSEERGGTRTPGTADPPLADPSAYGMAAKAGEELFREGAPEDEEG